MKIGNTMKPDEVAAFANAGGDYVEFGVQWFLKPQEGDAAFDDSLRIADECPLPIIAANGFLPGSLRSTGTDFDPQGILAYAAIAFARAQKIGIRHIVFGSGGSRELKDDFPADEATDQFVLLLQQMGPVAAEHQVTVVVEPLRTQECNFINTVAEGAEICRRVDHPNIQLLADVYHMMHNGETAQSIVDAGPLIKHAHLAENENRTCPGIDGTDFVPFFKAFARIGYTGSISIEGRWPDGVEADGPKAVRVMREQMAAAGVA